MSYGVAPVGEFPGLDLRSAPDQAGCIDGVDFDLDQPGVLRSRDGFAEFTDDLEINNVNDQRHVGVYFTPTGVQIAGSAQSGKLGIVDSTGALIDEDASGVDGFSFVSFGSPTVTYMYFVKDTITGQVRRWDGTNFTAPVGMPAARYLAVQPNTLRLVAAGSQFNPGDEYKVQFSDGTLPPETFTDNVILDPDGDPLTGVCSWRDYTFVFKRRTFYVFYGNATDAVGDTEFRYRRVDSGGVGHSAEWSPLAVAPDGVYFLHSSGVYRTTGGPPQKVSQQIDPLFTGRSLSSFFDGQPINQDQIDTAGIAYHEGRLLVSVAEGDATRNTHTYVYDGQNWIRWGWGFQAGQIASVPLGWLVDSRPTLLRPTFGRTLRMGDYDTDNGTAIGADYRTGFFDLGRPGQEKDISGTDLWGTGTVTVESSRDFGPAEQAEAVQLGTDPQIALGRHAKEEAGEVVSYRFSGQGRWALHRYVHYLRGDRPSGSRRG